MPAYSWFLGRCDVLWRRRRLRWQVSGVLAADSAEVRRLGNMSAAASDKKPVGSISTRGLIPQTLCGFTWTLNMQTDSRTFPKLQGFPEATFLYSKWGFCVDHLQQWLGKELWKKCVDHQARGPSPSQRKRLQQLICQSSTSHFAAQQWNCSLEFEPRVGARDAREGTRRQEF